MMAGRIWLGLRGTGEPDEVLAELVSEEGTVVLNQSFSTRLEEAEWNMNGCFRVEYSKTLVSKRIWRAATVPDPDHFKKAGVVQDVVEKTAAFRDIQMTALFSYRINERISVCLEAVWIPCRDIPTVISRNDDAVYHGGKCKYEYFTDLGRRDSPSMRFMKSFKTKEKCGIAGYFS